MAKKKNITQTEVISWYMEYVLEHNEAPKSVFSFAKQHNFEEALFYTHFSSFEEVEKGVFKAFFDNTINVLEQSEDYASFDARNQLLTFYFTFFENLTANRSYVVYALGKQKKSLRSVPALQTLKKSFVSYIEGLDIETLDFKEERIEKIVHRGVKESAWMQLLATLKFWLEDTSSSFEKTDIFIEKSINTSFDVINTTPVKSVIDLAKFLFKEKASVC